MAGTQPRHGAWANLVRGAVPLMERLGVASAGEVDADTLADRILSDVRREKGIVIGPGLRDAVAGPQAEPT